MEAACHGCCMRLKFAMNDAISRRPESRNGRTQLGKPPGSKLAAPGTLMDHARRGWAIFDRAGEAVAYRGWPSGQIGQSMHGQDNRIGDAETLWRK
jgi:hypothetical protein